MTQSKPLSDERLRWSLNAVRLLATPGVMAPEAAEAIQNVLAELERQRAENERLRDLARVVAEADNSDASVCYQLCQYDMGWTDDDHFVMTHRAPCVAGRARAAVADPLTAKGQQPGYQASAEGSANEA